MKDKVLTFAIIGKPNNGKSSIISAIIMDDEIEISSKTGTTKKSIDYVFNHRNEKVCRFYDTPGFEYGKKLWAYIDKNKSNSFGNRIFEDFIDEYRNNKGYNKDIEIIEAILNSDYLVFVVDTSKNVNFNNIASELSIMLYIKNKPKIVLFNQIEKGKDYSQNWKNTLQKFDLNNIHHINLLENSYDNMKSFFTKLYTVDAEKNNLKSNLDAIQNAYKERYKNNINKSAELISEYILKMISYKQESVFIKKITDNDKKRTEEKYKKAINKIEKSMYKEVQENWGYKQVKVKDERAEFNAKENLEYGLTPARLIALGTAGGVGLGAFFAPVDGGLSAFLCGLIGGGSAWLAKEKMYTFIISKQKIIWKIAEKDVNTSFILLSRALEHLETIVKHGHANRTTVTIKKVENFEFTKDEEKKIAKIHKSFVLDENTDSNKKELNNIIVKKIKKRLKNNKKEE